MKTITTLLLVVSIVFLIMGIVMQEHSKVFDQAIRICLSCIGMG